MSRGKVLAVRVAVLVYGVAGSVALLVLLFAAINGI